MSPVLPGMAARRMLPKYHAWMAGRRSLIAHRVFSSKVTANVEGEFDHILKPDSACTTVVLFVVNLQGDTTDCFQTLNSGPVWLFHRP